MATAHSVTKTFPKTDSGYFHLTEDGWVRKDDRPFPANRLETWRYEMECESEADKEKVHLTRIWSGTAPERADRLRQRYGEAIPPSHERHITVDCNG
ncbi:MAG TPA: hypothetical protein VG722_09280 [Tepidisphaeraceae bacterium]|nr:hypothetical protein [Tepidisphaeraceae bacterium]